MAKKNHRKGRGCRRVGSFIEELESRQLLAGDLSIAITTTPSPLTLSVGQTIDLNALGIVATLPGSAGDIFAEVHLSQDTVFGNGDDLSLGTTSVKGSGTVRPRFFTSNPIPAFLPAGTYYFAAQIQQFTPTSNEIQRTAFTDQPLVTIPSNPINDPGSTPSTTGDAGTMTLNLPNLQFIASDSARQSDGKLVIVGQSASGASGTLSQGQYEFATLRLNADGTLDTTFGNAGTVITVFPGEIISEAKAVAIAPDGKIVVGGTVDLDNTGANDIGLFALTRLNADGSRDRSFGKNGYTLTNLDPTFKHDEQGIINDLVILSDRSILVAGEENQDMEDINDFEIEHDRSFFVAAHYTPTGILDTTFATHGEFRMQLNKGNYFEDGARAIAVIGSKIYLAGSSTSPGFDDATAVIRLSAQGQFDKSFGKAGVALISIGELNGVQLNGEGISFERATSIAADSAGRLVIGSTIDRGSLGDNDVTSIGVARFLPNGKPDLTFGNKGAAAVTLPGLPFAFLDRVVPQVSGGIIVVGRAAATGGDLAAARIVPVAVRLLPDGQLDTSFSSSGVLRLFQPTTSSAPGAPPTLDAAAASSSTVDTFNTFLNSSLVIVSVTEGGAIALLAATSTDSGTQLTMVLLSGNDPAVQQPSAAPDLTASAKGRIPAAINPASKTQITLTISNAGVVSVKGKVPVLLIASTDPQPGADDLPFSSVPILLNLPADKSTVSSVSFKLPQLQSNTRYYLFAVINDGSGAVPESNRDNNITKAIGPFVLLSSPGHNGK